MSDAILYPRTKNTLAHTRNASRQAGQERVCRPVPHSKKVMRAFLNMQNGCSSKGTHTSYTDAIDNMRELDHVDITVSN